MLYDVIKNGKLDSLIKEVNSKIIEGWELVGGVVIDSDENTITFYQTIIF